jgi:hypothetical protein
MHEAHTIYRVETTAKWNLHPNVYPYPPGSLPGGPVVGIIDPAHKNSPITPEIAAEVDRQKIMSQALMADHQEMNQSLKQLSTVIPAMSQVVKENAVLKVRAKANEQRLEILEDEFRRIQQKERQQEAQQQQHENEVSQPVMAPVIETNGW